VNLKRIENVLERAFEGVFDRALPGRLHPVELGEALWQAMEEGQAAAQVPNRLLALVSSADLEALAGVPIAGAEGVEAGLRQRAAERGWSPGLALLVALRADAEARPGSVSVRARLDREPVPAHLLVESGPVAGEEVPLHPGALLGRSQDCDVRLFDDAVSSTHCRFDWTFEGYRVVDLMSRNGTFVNDVRVQEYTLLDGQVVGVGRSRLQVAYDLEGLRRALAEG
jgi:hypothetical protein